MGRNATHGFVSPAADDADANSLSPSHWNGPHKQGALIFDATGAVLDLTPAASQDDYNPAGLADAAILRLNPSTNVVISGLAGGESGRQIILRNDAADYLVILPDQSTLSSAANRFDFRNPVFLMPGATVTLLYDATDSRWRLQASSAGIGYGAFFDEYCEFHGSLGGFGSSVAGTGASAQVGTYLVNSTERPFGVWQADTGTTATGRAMIGSTNATHVVPAQGPALVLFRLAVEALSTGTDRYQIFAGFQDSIGGTNVTDGVYWLYDDAASAAWQGATASNSTRTTTGAAGPTVDTNYIWLGIHINAAWTRANYFYSTDSVTWTFAGSQTVNIPSATRYTAVGAAINKTIGTAQRNLSVDMMGVRYDMTRG